jgi:hypothetical protein
VSRIQSRRPASVAFRLLLPNALLRNPVSSHSSGDFYGVPSRQPLAAGIFVELKSHKIV